MRQNLIDLIKSEKELSSAIILTHNIDFVFLQLVVIPALKAANHPKLTIFVDAACAADTFESQAQIVGGIGINYRVVPVVMSAGFRFHPKAVMLSGPKDAKLFIGSGNLTYGGWIENAEIWVELETSKDGTAQFTWFYNYLREISKTIPFPETILAEIDEAFDAQNHQWASGMDTPAGLIGIGGDDFPALIEQIVAEIGMETAIDRITVCTPYFDKSAKALKALSKRFGNPPTRVLIQNGRSNLLSKAAETLPANIDLIPISFRRSNKDGGERESFVHAKYFAFKQTDTVTVFSGSANCSQAALTIGGINGNAELMAVQFFTRDEFQENILNDIKFNEEELKLANNNDEIDTEVEKENILITAARLESGDLFVGYRTNKAIGLTKCIIDDNSVSFEKREPGELIASCNWHARYVRLAGVIEGREILSNLCWVDHEKELRATARGRWLTDTIRRKIRDEYWGLGAWAEIMDAFSKHLQYVPTFAKPTSFRKTQDDGNAQHEYTEEDVFSSNYGLGSLSMPTFRPSKTSSVKALRDLLLKWFGCTSNESTEDQDGLYAPEGLSQSNDNPDDQEDIVDVVEELRPPVKQIPIEEVTEAECLRINKFINQLVDTMCGIKYLENRPLEMMATDLNLIAVMLLTGVRETWLSRDDFIRFTKQIWNRLFLSAEPNNRVGWIEYRNSETDPAEHLIDQMRSPELSAILAAWSLSIPLDFSSAERSSFNLCCIMSVARLPELWIGGSSDQITEKLKSDLLPTVSNETFDPKNPEMFGKKWNLIIRLGYSVRALERALGHAQPIDLKDKVSWSKIPVGTLLWQGNNGFYVTVEPVVRTQHKMANVVTLDGEQNFSAIKPDFLIPMKNLIDTNCQICRSKIEDNHRKYLGALAYSVRKGARTAGHEWFNSHEN